VYAVVRALEIISEATRRLPDELLLRHPNLEWKAIAAAGNIYRHEYELVDETLVWNTVQHGLEMLRAVAQEELGRIHVDPE
jgi:uncharacterized protein with HEPN domain